MHWICLLVTNHDMIYQLIINFQDITPSIIQNDGIKYWNTSLNHYQLQWIWHRYNHATMSKVYQTTWSSRFPIQSSVLWMTFLVWDLRHCFSMVYSHVQHISHVVRLRPFFRVFDWRKIHVRPSGMDALEGMMRIRPERTICQVPDFSLLRISKSTMASGMIPRTRVWVPRILLASAQERAPSTKVTIMPMWYMDFLNAPLSPSLSAW